MSKSNLKNDYLNVVIPKLQYEFQYKNKKQRCFVKSGKVLS
jgi:hypothetical protein